MPNANTARLEKVVNPNLAFAALNCAQPYGEFKTLVKLASHKPFPAYMEGIEFYSPNVVKARIPCNQIGKANADSNVISIEIQEHITSNRKA